MPRSCQLPGSGSLRGLSPSSIPSSAHWPSPRPQAPGWQLPHSPRCRLSQILHPEVEAGQQGLLQPAWDIMEGVAGRSQDPVVAERGAAPAAVQACLARLQASSSPSHPPSAGLRLLTSEMRQYPGPNDMSIQYTHLPDDRGTLASLPLFYLYNNSNIYILFPLF